MISFLLLKRRDTRCRKTSRAFNTSGEVRVYIEHRCRFVDPIDRAAEVFYSLKMEQTVNRNGVLVYVAVKDRQLAIFADEGIFQKAGADFWKRKYSKCCVLLIKKITLWVLQQRLSKLGKCYRSTFPMKPAPIRMNFPTILFLENNFLQSPAAAGLLS